MADKLEVLLVEDEESKVKQWTAAVEAFNADVDKNGFVINTLTAASIAAAMETIARAKVDALVVDLRLEKESGVGEDNDDGNELIRRVVETTACGVAVYTGQKGQANLKDYPREVEVFDKGDGAAPVLDWLSRQRVLLTQLRAVNQAVERETAKVFFKSIWPRWKRWSGQGTEVSDALARHVTAHVHDALLDAAKGGAHPEEAYFVPPLKERLDTGDLVRIEDDIWAVVTPRCDLANEGNVVTLLLAKCKNVQKRYDELEQAVKQATEAKKEGATKSLMRFVQHDSSLKQHFLPPAFDVDGNQLGPWMVQFNDLQVLPVEQGMANLPKARIASLAPQFVPSLVERFGSYFSRIGTPNMSSE